MAHPSSSPKSNRPISIGAQLLRISVAMIVAVLIVLALAGFGAWSVRQALAREAALVHRWALVNHLRHTIDTFRVAAGSAAIYHNGGKVPGEIREAARSAGESALVEIGQLSQGSNDADLAERLAVIKQGITDLRRKVEDDLFGLVEASSAQVDQLNADFGKSDDTVDGYCVSIQGRVTAARPILGETGHADLQQLSGDAYRLNLIAMDIIVDREEGMSEARKVELADAASALQTSADRVATDLVGHDNAIAGLKADTAAVVKAAAIDLPALVKRYLEEIATTSAHFSDLSAELDAGGGRVSAALDVVVGAIAKDHQSATSDLVHTHMVFSWAMVIATALALIGLIIGLMIFYRRINAGLSATLMQIREAVARLAVAAEQFSAGARRLAGGAENQASAIQQISSTMDEVSATARSNAETARQSESTTSAADTAAGGVSQAVDRLGKTMGQIREAATESAGVVLAIDEIAFQTKILAVNAAIEAARSGRANSGFSVLSEEIRSLAQQSVEAARRTGDRLRDSQEHSQVGEDVVREVAVSIAQVLSAVQTASRMAAAVSQSSNEQVRGVDQVNKSIAELNRTVQSNATEADETLATSASLRDQAGRLGELVGRLEAMVGKAARQIPANER